MGVMVFKSGVNKLKYINVFDAINRTIFKQLESIPYGNHTL